MPDLRLLSSRRGGGKRIPGVRYGEKALRVTPQLLWRAGTEGACMGARPESHSWKPRLSLTSKGQNALAQDKFQLTLLCEGQLGPLPSNVLVEMISLNLVPCC